MTFLLFVLFLVALCILGTWFERRERKRRRRELGTMDDQLRRATELHQTAQIYREMGDTKTADKYALEVYKVLDESPDSFRRRHEAGTKAGTVHDPPPPVEEDRA